MEDQLNALNDLKKTATTHESHQSSLIRCAKEARELRLNEDMSLLNILGKLDNGYSWDKLLRDEVQSLVNDMKADILRLAELRLQATARYHKVKAAQINAIITTSILPIDIEI